MFDIYKVAFFGHRYVEDILAIEHQLLPIMQELIEGHDFVEFYMGQNGAFREFVLLRRQAMCYIQITIQLVLELLNF